jgi:DNA invertase Pin-like site-specific DNA recombinase
MGTVGKRHQTPGAVGYVRVSTEEQATSGLSLESQRVAIDAECRQRRLPLLAVYEDAGMSSASLDRPGLARALEDLAAGAASALMVAKLDRLSRSVHDASGVMLQAQRQGWGLIALDVAVDTTTPQGEAMAHMASVFAQLERRLIGQRTADALAVKKAQGVRLGRPLTLPIDVADRILTARARGDGWTTIARALNEAQVPTARGGRRWYPSSVRAVVLSRSVDPGSH